jgi:hypothetical protein
LEVAETLCDELDEHPPTHLLVAAYLGVKRKKGKQKEISPAAAAMLEGLFKSQMANPN